MVFKPECKWYFWAEQDAGWKVQWVVSEGIAVSESCLGYYLVRCYNTAQPGPAESWPCTLHQDQTTLGSLYSTLLYSALLPASSRVKHYWHLLSLQSRTSLLFVGWMVGNKSGLPVPVGRGSEWMANYIYLYRSNIIPPPGSVYDFQSSNLSSNWTVSPSHPR